MKKFLSLFLCLCTLIGALSLWVSPATATMVNNIPNEEDIPTLVKDELVYSQNFESSTIDTTKTNSALISELGWFGSMGSNDSMSIVTKSGNHAVSLTAKTTRFDTVGMLQDDRLAGGNYILEYTVYLESNYLTDPERTFGFCSESEKTFKSNLDTAWRFTMKEDGTADHHLKINSNKVIDGGNSIYVRANDGISASLVGSSYRVRIVIDPNFGLSAYIVNGDKATLFSATTPATSELWRTYSSTISNKIYFHLLSGITATFDDIEVWTAKEAPDPIKLLGYQTTSLKNDAYDIRFVAGVATNAVSSMGFGITYSYADNGKTISGTKRVYCKYLYETISTDFGEHTISAEEEGYNYLMALEIKNISSSLAVTYTVTPFIEYKDGTEEIGLTKSYSVNKEKLMSVPALPGGFLEPTKEYTTNYYRDYYSDVSLSLYYDYVDLLRSYGFHLYDRNSLDGNEYATFTSDFIVVHAYYIACTNTISVLYTDIENWTPYETAPVSDGAVTNTVFAMASMDYDKDKDGTYNHNNGMGFVYTLEDGSYVIIDGGYAADADPLYQYLVTNNKRADGKILIRAWFISHPDGDHYGCFNEFTTKYASNVTLEYFVAQFDMTHINDSTYGSIIRTIYANAAKYSGCKNIIPMAGQTMYFGTLKVEFLYTTEMYQGYMGVDLGSGSSAQTNESSFAFKATLAGKTVFFAGDIVGNAITIVENIYSTALKCDFFQAPHHALNGTSALYSKTSPTYLIMCTHKEAANERWNEGRYDSQSKLSYLKSLGVVQHVFVADTGTPEIVPIMVGTTIIPQANPFS